MSGKAQQSGIDSEQGGFAFAPLDLGDSSPARCPKGLHDMPPGCVACPACLKVEGEKIERERHERMVLKAAGEIVSGGPEAPIFAAGVAGKLHFVAVPGEKKAFCGELVKNVTRKEFKDPYRMRGAYCRACREFIGLANE